MTANKSKYEIIKIQSCSSNIQFETTEKIANELINGWIIHWQHHNVFLGLIKDSIIHWNAEDKIIKNGNDLSHFVRSRAFNKSTELHFWASNQSINGRRRIDSNGNSTAVIDTNMVLRGQFSDAYIKHTETKCFTNKRVIIKTRNYIEYNTIGQATYTDSRFLNIELIEP